MLPASKDTEVLEGSVQSFRHPDSEQGEPGQVWVVWADNGTQGAKVALPVSQTEVRIHRVDGTIETVAAASGKVRLDLSGGKRISAPLLVEDRP